MFVVRKDWSSTVTETTVVKTKSTSENLNRFQDDLFQFRNRQNDFQFQSQDEYHVLLCKALDVWNYPV